MLLLGILLILSGVTLTIFALKLRQPQQKYTTQSVKQTAQAKGLESGIYQNVNVKYVHDGDSIDILINGQTYAIRLAYIDAPEYNSKKQKNENQAYGYESWQLVWQYIFQKWNKRANLKIIDQYEKYGRNVAEVYPPSEIGKGSSLNYELVKQGLAWYDRSHAPKGKELQNLYSNAESKAKKKLLGLWQQKKPQAPWDFRK